MPQYIFLNGRYVPQQKACIPVTDLGVIRGYSVFDLMVTAGGKPFLPDLHLKRLRMSAKDFGLSMPYSDKQILSIVTTLIKKNKCHEATIRTMITAGGAFFIIVDELQPHPQKYYDNGVRVVTTDLTRGLPQVKSSTYGPVLATLKTLNKKGIFEVIHTDNGFAREGGTSNFFIVKDGELITPKEHILMGVTRIVVAALAKANDIPVHERNVRTEELFTADEVFITASIKRVIPVVAIDGKKIGNGKPGAVTNQLMHLFNDYVSDISRSGAASNRIKLSF